jgi:hypothetical protein
MAEIQCRSIPTCDENREALTVPSLSSEGMNDTTSGYISKKHISGCTSNRKVLRIALCDAEDADKWRGYGFSTYMEALGKTDDIITYFHLPKNEHPSLEDVSKGRQCLGVQ